MAASDAQKLKALQSQQRQLLKQKTELDLQCQVIANRLMVNDCAIAALRGNSSLPVVSEHAQLRYLERVQGLDLQAVQNAILTRPVVEAAMRMGDGKFPSGDGFRAVVRSNTVVTVET
jgi:predicted transcriptional regulator